MDLVALAVAVAGNAALAAIGFIFYQRISLRISVLAQLHQSRYTAPPEVSVFSPPADLYSEMDIAGAWALEQERKGNPVSDEELDLQRRLWAAEV